MWATKKLHHQIQRQGILREIIVKILWKQYISIKRFRKYYLVLKHLQFSFAYSAYEFPTLIKTFREISKEKRKNMENCI